MAQPSPHNRNTILTMAGGAVLVLVITLLVVRGGENGRPSAPSGPGNPMQTDQGR
jgi:hypothetical protein